MTSAPLFAFPIVPEERFARRIESRLDAVEYAVQDVYEYAQHKARKLTRKLGRDPEYYLRVIFDRGAFIHPMSRDPSLNSLAFPDSECA